MRIGTITFYDGRTNYGQALQCYALIAYLHKLGHDAFYIKYDNQIERKRNIIRKLISQTIHWIVSPHKEIEKKKRKMARLDVISRDMEHPRSFDKFMEENIPSTHIVYSKDLLYETPPMADAYICGSDQIWNSKDPIMYLQFAPQGKKRIAYAPSFGGCVHSGKSSELIKKYLGSFCLVTCREQAGIKLCKSLGRDDALLFPDPTLLLNAEDYRALYLNKGFKSLGEDYILLYLLGNEIDVRVSSILEYANNKRIKVVYVASQGRFDNYPKIYPTIEEWLCMIDNAKYVITNSFHGTVFSMLFHKKFVTIPLSGRFAAQNDRITDLLNNYSLAHRIYEKNFDVLDTEIDFKTFEKKKNEYLLVVSNILNRQLSTI